MSKAWVRTDGVEEVGVEEVDGETEYMKEEVIDDSSVLVEETPGYPEELDSSLQLATKAVVGETNTVISSLKEELAARRTKVHSPEPCTLHTTHYILNHTSLTLARY